MILEALSNRYVVLSLIPARLLVEQSPEQE